MEFKELKDKSRKELNGLLAEQRQKLYELRLKLSVNQLKQVREVRVVKKNIAKLLTRINQLKKEEANK
ncbi:50S ribosomal protein L29 [Candidatus Parcubacteria bacterium]|nr:MAG: 50S ribosomal protein L29 [Candidatus Parcubacteria bacterium]